MTQQTITASQSALPVRVDWIVGVLAGMLGLGAVIAWSGAGLFDVNLFSTDQWSWYLVRAAGLTSFLLLVASMVWGVFLSSHLVKDWIPGTMSMLFHATTSWLAVVLMIAHMGLLLFDTYYTYAISDLLVPFTGPYRPFAVGLGIVAFWVILAVTISFSLRKLMSRRVWLWLHYTSYVAFGLVAVHALMAGTDVTRPAMVSILVGSVLLVGGMLVMRIRQSRAGGAAHA